MNETDELLQDFILEAKEHLETIEPNIFRLEVEPENKQEILNEIFRPMHSLKGASGFIGLKNINSLAHIAESVMDELRKDILDVNAEITDAILLTTDILSQIIQSLEDTGTEGNIDIAPISTILSNLLDKTKPTTVANTQDTKDTIQDVQDVQDTKDTIQATLTDTAHIHIGFLEHALHNVQQESNNPEYSKTLLKSLYTLFEYAQENAIESIITTTKNAIDIIEASLTNASDFSLLLPILDQEIQIIIDTTKKYLAVKEVEQKNTIKETIQEKNTASNDSHLKNIAENLEKITTDFKADHTITTIESLYKILYEINSYAEKEKLDALIPIAINTAEILEKSKDNKTDFSLLENIIIQEVDIILELIKTYLTSSEEKISHTPPVEKSIAFEENKKESKQIEEKTKTKEAEQHKQNTFIRVEHNKLDQLMNLIGELIITRNRYTLLVKELEGSKDSNVLSIAQYFAETTASMARISDALQNNIMQVRMVSLSTTFSRLPRLVRDVSKKSHKEIALKITGENTELDKNMVEALADPLLHLIRNAVDHGIELPEERKKRGKNPVGSILIKASHQGNSVIIEIHDDGNGLDPEKLKAIALKKNLLTAEELQYLSKEEAYELIFLPGFSGAAEVTDISGRGVGMDVVRNNLKNLKGSINIRSVLGEGTVFTLSVPLTLAIIDTLMVQVGKQIFAIPLDTVSETTKVPRSIVKTIQNVQAITLRGKVVSIISLAERLGLEAESEPSDIISIVIITINHKKVGLIVDALLERQEIVIKPLGNYPTSKTGISGATITGDGSVILILNAYELCSLVYGR